MTIKARILLATLFLSCGLLTSLKAQDKYEYGVIVYSASYRKIEISLNGESYNRIDLSKEEIKGDNDMNPAFKQLNKLLADGWELVNVNTSSSTNPNVSGQFFYIRRKLQ